MSDADKTTIKLRINPQKMQGSAPQSNLTRDQSNALELATKIAQLEEEKQKSLEHLKTIAHLRESLGQEQAKTAEMARKIAELEARSKEFAELEARVKELTGMLSEISNIAGEGRVS